MEPLSLSEEQLTEWFDEYVARSERDQTVDKHGIRVTRLITEVRRLRAALPKDPTHLQHVAVKRQLLRLPTAPPRSDRDQEIELLRDGQARRVSEMVEVMAKRTPPTSPPRLVDAVRSSRN